MADPIVIVGAGLAGSRAEEAIRQYGRSGQVLMLLDERTALPSLWLLGEAKTLRPVERSRFAAEVTSEE